MATPDGDIVFCRACLEAADHYMMASITRRMESKSHKRTTTESSCQFPE